VTTTKKVIIFRMMTKKLFEEKNRVTSSVTAQDDTNLSDDTH